MGGIADYTAALARHLQALGVKVTVVTGPGKDGSTESPVPVAGVSGWGLSSVRELARVAAEARADIVHIQYQAAAYGLSGVVNLLPLLLRATHNRARIVTTFHDLRPPYAFPGAGPLRSALVHGMVGASESAIFVDPGDLYRVAPNGRRVWIPIGPNIVPAVHTKAAAGRSRRSASKKLVLGFFGFTNRSKGITVLLRAVERLARSDTDVRLIMIGERLGGSDPSNRGEQEHFEALVNELGLGDRVSSTGPLAPSGVSESLGKVDIAVLPYADGASLSRGSLLTCLAHGVPVVTTRPGFSGAVPAAACVPPFDRPEGLRISDKVVALVPADDDAALAREIYRLANDPARRKRLAAAGAELAGRLTWPAIASATLEVYRRVMARAAQS